MVWTNNVNLLQSLSSSWSLSFLCKCVSSPQQWPCFHPQGRTWSIGINAYLHQHRIYRISVAAKKRKSSSDSQCVLWRWDAMGISQNGTQYRCLCFLVNYFTKKRQQLYPSDYSKFLSNPATCYIPLQRHQVAVRRPFLIKSWTILFFKSYVGKAGNSFKLAPILPSMMCSCQFVVLPLEIVLPSP